MKNPNTSKIETAIEQIKQAIKTCQSLGASVDVYCMHDNESYKEFVKRQKQDGHTYIPIELAHGEDEIYVTWKK